MTTQPNQQRLIIPGKQDPAAHPKYPTDMRTIEQWAGDGFIRKLLAGTNITLDPANGEGPAVKISASGGGGGSTPGFLEIDGVPDNLLEPWSSGHSIFLGQTLTPSTLLAGIGAVITPLFDNSSGNDVFYTNGNAWLVNSQISRAVVQCPFWTAPNYSAGDVSGYFAMMAMSLAGTDILIAETSETPPFEDMPSLSQGQIPVGDFSVIQQTGTHLSLTSSGGISGIFSSNAVPYIGAISYIIDVADGTTFT